RQELVALDSERHPSTTTRPPKRSRKSSIASSAIPPATPAILFDGAIAAPPTIGSMPKVEFLDVAVLLQACSVAVEHAAAILQHVSVVSEGERHGRILLDDNHRQAVLSADLDQSRAQFLYHRGREAE